MYGNFLLIYPDLFRCVNVSSKLNFIVFLIPSNGKYTLFNSQLYAEAEKYCTGAALDYFCPDIVVVEPETSLELVHHYTDVVSDIFLFWVDYKLSITV